MNELVNEPLSDDVVCLDIEDASKGRPSDDQVMMLIKEKTGATNSSAFQQLSADIKKSILVELKSRKASLRQLERLTGISKSMIFACDETGTRPGGSRCARGASGSIGQRPIEPEAGKRLSDI